MLLIDQSFLNVNILLLTLISSSVFNVATNVAIFVAIKQLEFFLLLLLV